MERLKTRSQFQAVLAGRIVARTPHFALHRLDLASLSTTAEVGQSQASTPLISLFPGPSGCWLGALVPKRWAKRAATRNAIRRQIYQVSAQRACGPSDMALVVRLRTTFDRHHFKSASSDALKQAVQAELTQLLGRLPPIPTAAAEVRS